MRLTMIMPFVLVGAAHAATSGFFLEIEMANPAGGSAALFYDVGQWYNQRDSIRLTIPADSELHNYRFAIAPAPVRRLRFDVNDTAGIVRIGRLRLTDDAGNVLDEFGPDCLAPMHDIKGYVISNGVALVTTGSDNPMLLIDRPLQSKTALALGLHLVGETSLIILSIIVAGAMLFTVIVALRSMPERKLAGMFFAGSALIVFGVRLAWLNAYSRPMPYWDEWEMDGADLLMPLRGHFLDLGSLFVPQSEHRTVVSRLIVLSGSILNGEWDPRVAMVAGAAMYAVSIGLICALATGFRRRFAVLASVFVIIIAAFPIDTRNLLCGDQCQMYALNMMAATVLCLSVIRPSSASIVAAALASAVSIFTMASGCVAPLLAAGIVFARAIRTPDGRRNKIMMATAFLCAGLAGLMLYKVAPFQGPTYAHTLREFGVALGERLSWPLPPGVGHILLVWLPWAIFAATCLLRIRALDPMDAFILGLGFWVLANASGLAHGRPIDHFPFDNKYYTSMLLVAVCAFLCILQLASNRRTAVVAVLSLFLFGPVAWALGSFFVRSPETARNYWRQSCSYDEIIRPYLTTGDRSLLYDISPGKIPYWNGAELAAQLDSPLMQPWLPAVLRQCLTHRPNSNIRDQQFPGPVTMTCRTAMKAGPYLAIAGACFLTIGAVTGAGRKKTISST
jgi:hypothetical protein